MRGASGFMGRREGLRFGEGEPGRPRSKTVRNSGPYVFWGDNIEGSGPQYWTRRGVFTGILEESSLGWVCRRLCLGRA